MSVKRMFILGIILVIISMLGCATQPTSKSQDKGISPPIDSGGIAEGTAELFVFNISGWTLIPGNQDLTDNGKVIISLPRNTYTKVPISSGPHDLGLKYRKRPNINLNVVSGETYYIVVGYKPERSWALPIAGDPLVIKQISEQEAKPLIKEFAQQ